MLAAALLSAWIQYAADGRPQVRAIAGAACPAALADGAALPLRPRAAASDVFPNVVCEATVPTGARRLSVAGRRLPLPPREARTVVVFGDTGCRIKGLVAQACDDPARWPFPRIARDIAAAHPDLIVHVGDYYYRESACPIYVRGCSGSPHGDAWPAWDADFFTPAAPLFAAAPLVLVRGNHEDCKRGGAGWFRYLDPRDGLACRTQTAPYAVTAGGARFVVFDDASADDAHGDEATVASYQDQLIAANRLARPGAWLLAHRPPYLNATLRRAARGIGFGAFAAIQAGHVHTFAALDLAGEPPLVITGMGGDLLDPFERLGAQAQALGAHVRATTIDARFGYAVYRRRGGAWALEEHAVDGSIVRRCTLGRQSVTCG